MARRWAQSYAFQLPNGPAGVGSLQVTVTTNYYDTIVEYYPGGVGYTNDTTTITTASTLAAYPDLQVTGLAFAPDEPQFQRAESLSRFIGTTATPARRPRLGTGRTRCRS